MSEKVEVVYIGPKPIKRITVNGKKFAFPRLKTVAIDGEVAYHLLDIPTVFSTPAEAQERVDAAKAVEEAEAKRKAELEASKVQQVKEQTFLVLVDGDLKDISKSTSAQLKTIITAESLAIEVDGKKPGELREAVRIALHEKHGNPETKEG